MEEHNIPYISQAEAHFNNEISPISTNSGVSDYFNTIPNISPRPIYTFSDQNNFMEEDVSEPIENDHENDHENYHEDIQTSEISEPTESDEYEYEPNFDNNSTQDVRDLLNQSELSKTELSETPYKIPYKTRSGRISKGEQKSTSEIFKETSDISKKFEDGIKADRKSNNGFRKFRNDLGNELDNINSSFNTDSMTNILNNLSEPSSSQPLNNLNSLSNALPKTDRDFSEELDTDSDSDSY